MGLPCRLTTATPPYEDEARVGQQGGLTYVWADRGSRACAPRELRYQYAFIFGAICPARGVGAGLVLPTVNIEAMNLHLGEISRNVQPGSFAVIKLDGAGWHQTGDRLKVPDNMALLKQPPYSPELNQTENIWQFQRQNYLSHRVFADYNAVVDACCDAWNKLIALPETIRSIESRI